MFKNVIAISQNLSLEDNIAKIAEKFPNDFHNITMSEHDGVMRIKSKNNFRELTLYDREAAIVLVYKDKRDQLLKVVKCNSGGFHNTFKYLKKVVND